MMISVIVPVYNVEQYLEKCVDSIIRQTYKQLEIILVDDGSTDSSGQICDLYKEKDNRIVVIHKKNGGLSDARNVGIDIASGELLAFVDSDDWIDDDMYEVLYQSLIKHDADIAECSYRNICIGHIDEETANTGACVVADKLYAMENQLRWKDFRSIACNKIYKKYMFDNLHFPIGKLHEDEFTIYKTFYQAKKLVSIDLSKYNYVREREGSITSGFTERNLDKCEAMKEKLEFIRQKEDLYPIRNKMEQAYYWVIFDALDECFTKHIKGNRVDAILDEIKRDYWNIIRSDIHLSYKIQLNLLMVSHWLFVQLRRMYLRKNRKA